MLASQDALKRIVRCVAVCLAVCLLSACAFHTGICGTDPKGKLTYYIASIREKKIQGNWGARAALAARQETINGRWALETAPATDQEDGPIDAEMRDSTGAVVWQGRVRQTVLSVSQPAFVSYSEGYPEIEVYNIAVRKEPVYSGSVFPISQVIQSPDGTVFGLVGYDGFSWMSTRGDLLGQVPFGDSIRAISYAIADSGTLVAIGAMQPHYSLKPKPLNAKEMPQLSGQREIDTLHEHSRPNDGATTESSADPDRSMRQPFGGATPGRPQSEVFVFDRRGNPVTTLASPQLRGIPRALAISGGSVPLVAIANDFGVSLWKVGGDCVWYDSTAFAPPGREGVRALCVTGARGVLSVGAGSRIFRAWDRSGLALGQIVLPADLDITRESMLCNPTDTSASIRTEHQVATVKWR
ncbi:MAG: hypothetical protein AB1792_08105 [Candidatus Zixiibacteriota bacterium]